MKITLEKHVPPLSQSDSTSECGHQSHLSISQDVLFRFRPLFDAFERFRQENQLPQSKYVHVPSDILDLETLIREVEYQNSVIRLYMDSIGVVS
ncbi:MAG: hypothetical protein KJ070_26530 [Verrucomicrobia bacterium]|nr:hypothetical protein [Verrucomicrobiota bacterium]